MKILAIDSSSRRRTVALCACERMAQNSLEVVGQAEAPSERGGRFASLVEEVLEQSRVEREEVDALVVGVGPGSAAGIRSTLAFAMGWKLARNVSLTGFSSVWGLAVEAQRLGARGELCVVLPGPLGKIIFGRFQVAADAIRESQALGLVDELSPKEFHGKNSLWVGPELDSAFAAASESGPGVPDEDRRWTVFPTASALAELLVRDCRDAVRPLEPEILVTPQFVQAPPPRPIPEI